jgi:ABC-type phosphate/phosphonate transport system permease subunit
VDIEAIRCSECGYSPVDNGKIGRKIFVILGIPLTGTIIGAVLGIPMILVAKYVEKSKQGKGATGIKSGE